MMAATGHKLTLAAFPILVGSSPEADIAAVLKRMPAKGQTLT
jgi:hypothetical protein